MQHMPWPPGSKLNVTWNAINNTETRTQTPTTNITQSFTKTKEDTVDYRHAGKHEPPALELAHDSGKRSQ